MNKTEIKIGDKVTVKTKGTVTDVSELVHEFQLDYGSDWYLMEDIVDVAPLVEPTVTGSIVKDLDGDRWVLDGEGGWYDLDWPSADILEWDELLKRFGIETIVSIPGDHKDCSVCNGTKQVVYPEDPQDPDICPRYDEEVTLNG